MLMIIYLLRLLNLLKVESWKYLLFVASCLYMWICVYLSAGFGYPFGFRVSIRVSGIHSDFGYPRVWFWWWISTRIGFGFGFRFRVSVLGARRLHPIRTRPVVILTRGRRKWHFYPEPPPSFRFFKEPPLFSPFTKKATSLLFYSKPTLPPYKHNFKYTPGHF